ncbi:transposase IS116/IS110/IS902 family protein [Modicisalibacter xianhensis]|uniref:Transposase IS116/IS110/IS902 family protein n=1 Tax=Modicisalibacter xianhensis TaxID=442341 RepID=A0A4R8FHX9_9GAMM|nr:transposase [Halomonas xianhensis]TDX22497.1 transposase IS116/IS110/IS902 family protein [Halomonas xianhensis]
MRILRSIVSDQRDPAVLASYRDPPCKASEANIQQALTGHYRNEHLLALAQSLSVYNTYQELVMACNQHIEASLVRLAAARTVPEAPLPVPRHRKLNPSAQAFDIRGVLYRVVGTDLTQLSGIGSYLALKLIDECGLDMTRWPAAKHFTSWLALSPCNKISGGKVLSSQEPSGGTAAPAGGHPEPHLHRDCIECLLSPTI